MARDRIFGDDVKKEESHTQTFIKTLVHSFYPNKYPALTSRQLKQAFDYLFTIVFFCVFIIFVFSIYQFAQFQYNIDNEMAKFTKLDAKVDFELKEPIVFGKNDIVIDNERNYTDETLLITQEGISTKSLMCILMKPACIFENEPKHISSEELSDVSGYTDSLKNYSFLFFVLLLPGLLLLFLAYYLIKFLLIITAAALLAFIVTRLARYEIGIKQIYLCAIYSSTVMVLLEILNLYFMYFYLIPVIAYIILFTICIMVIGEREKAYTKDTAYPKRKNKEI
jgi:hypothetical protein